jgi:hypothetical protein
MENKRKLLVVLFVTTGILFMADAFAGNQVLNFLLGLTMAHLFVSNIVIDFLIGLALSISGSLFWLGAE